MNFGMQGAGYRWLGMLALALAAQSAQAAGEWTFTDIGYPPDGRMSTPGGINEHGQVAGSSFAPRETVFMWQGGVISDLETRYQSSAYGLNDAGQVVGGAFPIRPGEIVYGYEAALWTNGAMVSLGVLSGGRNSTAYDINNSGQVVGVSDTLLPYSDHKDRAFLWNGTSMVDLGALTATGSSGANAINASGQVVGYSSAADGFGSKHAVLWDKGQLIDLSGSSASRFGDSAYDINDVGQIVGIELDKAVLWQDGQRTVLGGLAGDDWSAALAINNAGVAVGFSDRNFSGSNDQRAVMWLHGEVIDLNSLADVVATGWTLLSATDINEAGQIVGMGVNPQGFYQGYVLSPVPEVNTQVMSMMGLLAVSLLRLHRRTRSARAA
ncbi:MAG TPA: hypothetical protein H9903_13970 [Candidatus Aquabacterium excrementipullorum]|nr:hypothetical protein [Candidatus Aquabacterium excrementipullorum]